MQEAAYGGKLCAGEDGGAVVLQVTDPCNEDIPCDSALAPRACMLTEWGEWSSCDPDDPSKATQRYRSRSVAFPSENGGAACDTELEETKACEASDVLPPVDCELSHWTPWRLCDKSCEGGQTYRTRSVEGPARRGGRACEDNTKETAPCNEMPCSHNSEGADCVVSQWTLWAGCSTSCGQGVRERSRSILVPPLEGGLGCNAITLEADGCVHNPPCASQDCEWGRWAQWTECSKSCDGGQRSRLRSVMLPPVGSGKSCTALDSVNELQSCGTEACSTFACKDGLWDDWQAWGQCSRACGGGLRWRHRKIAAAASSCGKPAVGDATQEASCNSWNCEADRDCVMAAWVEWSACSASCYGEQTRKREIKVQGSGSGKWCSGPAGEPTPLDELRSCNGVGELDSTEACGFGKAVDCILESWTSWSECSKSCDGGQHMRERRVLRPSQFGGQPCNGSSTEVSDCGTRRCGIVLDCVWDDWGQWGACNRCDGEKIRIRDIRHLGNSLGELCESSASRQVAQCNECPVEKTYWCVWADWEDGSCSATCGTGGKMRRTRMLDKTEVQPQNVADAVGNVTGESGSCSGREVDYTVCKDVPLKCTTCIPQNCSFADWTEWEQPTTCDGLCHRTRKITELNNNCGKACAGSLRDTMACLISDCDGDQVCTFSQWSAWSGCTDGESQQARVREIASPTGPLGHACEGPQMETIPCETDNVKVDCELSTWGAWGKCSKLCGGGQQEHSRHVVQHARHGGQPCNGSLAVTRTCSEGLCDASSEDADHDCVLDDWSEWKGCTGHSVQAYRDRRPLRQATGSGEPCEGVVRESGRCPRARSQDCLLADWAEWGQCSETCGGGQRFRTREISMEAQLGGRPCQGDMHEAASCSEMPCNLQSDCATSQWSLWSECSVSCGQGQQVRQRKILQSAEDRGVGCTLSLLDIQGCEGSQTSMTCGDHVDCLWAAWTDWSGCRQAEFCGLGYRTRGRHIEAPPRGKGASCDPLPKREVRPDVECAMSCTKAVVCTDGEWGGWASWGDCSVTCGPGGTRSRDRYEVVKANHCGRPALGSDLEFEPCNAEGLCEHELGAQDCVFGEWENWGVCSSTCNGAKRRSRAIRTYSLYGGAECAGPVSESQRCNPSPGEEILPLNCQSGEPVDCELLPFAEWSGCSAVCGSGHRVRERQVSLQPAFGGKSCENPLAEVKECNASAPCSVLSRDCEYGDWEAWEKCDPVTAQRARARNVRVAQEGFGAACEGPMREVESCARACQEKTYFCRWATWKAWGSCSTSCGPEGRRTRTRSLELVASEEPGQPASSDVAESPSTALEERALRSRLSLEEKFEEGRAEELHRRLLEASAAHRLGEVGSAFAAGLFFAGLAAVVGLLSSVAVRRRLPGFFSASAASAAPTSYSYGEAEAARPLAV
ncbi:unnamed protein product [Polarella glacialis]|uniref:Spondin-like TSP1 domain-containing protein n=1 Tax=Polarella glacialis TaxID=89957 RepID=A0A813KG45_POLGL|nr:unnamed protein product [Polarella glacialis]